VTPIDPAGAEVVNCAVPPADSVSVSIGDDDPTRWNLTVPVGVPAPGSSGLTVAVNVTDCPNTGGFGDADTDVVVSVVFSVAVLGAKLTSPE
jgi:hypothetical protein